MVSREQLHQAIDELSPRNLEKLSEFVEFLRFKEDNPDLVRRKIFTTYSLQSAPEVIEARA